ncbi:MAG: hypothetical protein ACOC10_08280, partial [Bacteroidota bacterium]
NSSYKPLFTSTVKEQVEKIPYDQFAQLPHIKITSWAPEFYSSDLKDTHLLSPVSLEYLSRIKALSVEYKFELTLLPPPVNITRKSEIEKLRVDWNKASDIKEELEHYLSKITYLDSIEFKDGLHLIRPEEHTHEFFAEIKI